MRNTMKHPIFDGRICMEMTDLFIDLYKYQGSSANKLDYQMASLVSCFLKLECDIISLVERI